MILIGGNPFWLVQTLWKRDLEIALGMAHPAVAATAAVYVPSDMWPRGTKAMTTMMMMMTRKR